VTMMMAVTEYFNIWFN